jgi:hypothetical protein
MKNLVFYIFICLIVSCANDNKSSEEDYIRIPDTLVVYNTMNSTDSMASKSDIISKLESFTIFTSINVSCATCLFEFDKWRAIGNGFKDNTVSIVPICHSKDNFEMLKYLFESGDIKPLDFPLYLDDKNKFTELNKHLLDENHGLTVLVDTDNKILLKGSPIDDQTLMKKYTKLINTQK